MGQLLHWKLIENTKFHSKYYKDSLCVPDALFFIFFVKILFVLTIILSIFHHILASSRNESLD